MAADAANSRTPSPDKSLTSLLRRGSRRDSRASSFVSGEGSESATNNRRNSLKVGLDRLKDTASRRSSDLDGRAGDSPSRLSRIVRSKSRRKSKDGDQGLNNSERDPDNSTRGRISRRLGIGQPNTEEDSSLQVAGAGNSKLNVNASTDSLGGSRSAASSLLTEDSEPEIPPSRPQFVSRHSHKGLLTFNSPLIATETVPVASNESEGPANASNTATTAAADTLAPSSVTLSGEPGPTSVASAPQSDLSDKHPKAVAKTSSSSSGAASPRSPRSPRVILSPISTSTTTLPATLVTPPTPRLDREPSPPKKAATARESLSTKPAAVPSKDIAHRRTRSAVTSTSGRSSGQVATLTPTAEESKTPGGSVLTPSGSSGFFSSVFSATNNAITQISNTFQITGGPNQRTRSGTSTSEPDKVVGVGGEEVILHSRAQTRDGPVPVEPAVKTLGSGNLSLSHLGISDSLPDFNAMTSQPEVAPSSGHSPPIPSSPGERENVPMAAGAAAAAAAIDAAYNEKVGPQVVNDSVPPSARPLSISSAVNSIPGDQTPPRRDTLQDSIGVQRSGSVRSRFSGRRKKRSRGSSAATGSAIAAALAHSSSALVNPTMGPQRTTGFAVASSKRNKDFHALFKSVPEDDYLIEDYSAALQRDILLHGRMYVSERHICFSSNILGWQTNLVMNFDEVVAMEKKSTAMIFPNAIVIQTLHAKNVFASFLSRDPTYDLLIGIWKIGHPNLKTSDNGHVLDDQAKSEMAESVEGEDDEDDEDETDYSGETRSSGLGSIMESAYDVNGSDAAEATRIASNRLSKGDNGNGGGSGSNSSPTKPAEQTPAVANDSPGPATHAPTECVDQDSHYDKELVDTTIPAPLGVVYDMMFGPKSGVVMRKFLVDDQSSRELDMDDDKTGMGESVKSFSYSYIKPLNSSIGPKQTKCLVNQTLDAFDLEKAVSVTCSTQTPDVPSGNVFVTKTKYCLMWGPGNSTRFIMNFTVEWSGKSWIKGPIEKGAFDGQTQYGKDIVRFMTAQVSSRSSKSPRAGGKVKSKKRSRTDGSAELSKSHGKSQSATNQSGGVLSMLGPVGDVVAPLLTPVAALSIMLLLMTTLWLRAGRGTGPSRLELGTQMHNFEDRWWREENQLWDWLEDRLELEHIATPLRASSKDREPKYQAASQASPKHVRDEKQLDEAIRVTEERLNALKRSRGM